VRLRAVDAQNHAVLPDAGAMLGTLQMGGRFLKREGDALVMHGLAPGAYSLEIMAASRCGETREFVLRAAEDLDLGDVSLSAVRPFALHFTDRDEKPLAIEFNLERLVPGDPRATMARFAYRTYRSQPDGTADLQSVSPGRWVVRIDRQMAGNGPGMEEPTVCARPTVIDTSDPAASEAKIVLEPVGELVLLPRSASVRGLRFYLDTLEGLPARSGHLYDGSPLRIGIAPGPYRFSIEDEDGIELLRRSIEIGPKAVEVEVAR